MAAHKGDKWQLALCVTSEGELVRDITVTLTRAGEYLGCGCIRLHTIRPSSKGQSEVMHMHVNRCQPHRKIIDGGAPEPLKLEKQPA